MKKVKFRKFAKLSIATKPLLDGCNASNYNLDLLDEIDALGLSRERALICDAGGELHKVHGWRDKKLTEDEKKQLELEYQTFFNKDK